MKIKVWTDANGKLTNWANANDSRPLGLSSDGYEVIEVDNTDNLYEQHASIVDGKVVPDSGYTPDADRPTDSVSTSAQLAQLKGQNDELQSALLELSDIVLQGGNINS